MKIKKNCIYCIFCLIMVFPKFCSAQTITIGSISDEPAEEIQLFYPFATYLGKNLKVGGIVEGKVVITPNILKMAEMMKTGKVDIYIDSPFPSMAVNILAGGKPFLRQWKWGVESYCSVIFVRKESGISRLEDLKGHVIAFEEPFSSSSFFLPKMALKNKLLKPVLKKSYMDAVSEDEVGYVFSYDDENTMEWCLRKKVAAGAMNEHNCKLYAKEKFDNLRIIYKTYSIPRHVVNHRKDLSLEVIAQIKKVLLEMNQSIEGRNILYRFEETTRFDDLPKESFERIIESIPFIEKEIAGHRP